MISSPPGRGGPSPQPSPSTSRAFPFQPPTAVVTAPDSPKTIARGQALLLRGLADDAQDGRIPDDGLVWTSDRDGVLGAGGNLVTSDLSVGTHTISLLATNTQGLTATAAVEVTVTEEPGPSLALSPPGLTFLYDGQAHPPAQNIWVGNVGPGSLAWTASVDDPRISLEPASGTAPTDVAVSVDTSGLAGGTSLVAHVTIEAPGADDSPRVIEVAVRPSQSPFSLSADSVDFGTQVPSGSEPRVVTFTYYGPDSIRLAGAQLAGGAPGDFALSDDDCANATLTFGQSCTFSIAFQPTRHGLRTGYVVVATDDGVDHWYVALTGRRGAACSAPSSAGEPTTLDRRETMVLPWTGRHFRCASPNW